MNKTNTTTLEKKIQISETDIVNGGEVLILIAYSTKENDELWSHPTPQVFNKELYEKNKLSYDDAVKQFRADCENLDSETPSV